MQFVSKNTYSSSDLYTTKWGKNKYLNLINIMFVGKMKITPIANILTYLQNFRPLDNLIVCYKILGNGHTKFSKYDH